MTDSGKTIMPFGKYAGEYVADIVMADTGYARWCSVNLENEKLREAFEAELGEE